jgi:hypothetical protein
MTQLQFNMPHKNFVARPEILTHPNVPKPLHGLNPRNLKGRSWWDSKRKAVYKSTNYRCIACGVEGRDAQLKQYLEAHEYYDIDYTAGVCTLQEIVPLCHCCHNFIHSGYVLVSYQEGKRSLKTAQIILEHGFRILADNDLECFPNTLEIAHHLDSATYGVRSYSLPVEEVAWGDWKLVFEGKEYRSKFASFREWEAFYSTSG